MNAELEKLFTVWIVYCAWANFPKTKNMCTNTTPTLECVTILRRPGRAKYPFHECLACVCLLSEPSGGGLNSILKSCHFQKEVQDLCSLLPLPFYFLFFFLDILGNLQHIYHGIVSLHWYWLCLSVLLVFFLFSSRNYLSEMFYSCTLLFCQYKKHK